MQKNIFGKELECCCKDPMTGYLRDGYCHTEESDFASHTVCAQVTDAFLSYSKALGNDMSTPKPEYQFSGLKEGDKWCLCASRWKQAYEDGVAPKLFLDACNEQCLEIIDKEILLQYAVSK
mgnify:CR=1 FL=1|jgi:uncharacterized protein